VPFTWTFNLLREYLFVNIMLLVSYYALDSYYYSQEPAKAVHDDDTEIEPLGLKGALNFVFFAAIIAAVAFAPSVDVHAIEEGFATLTWAVIAIGLPTGLALLSLSGQENPWATGLTPAICLVLLLRARVLPLVPQRIALLIAGLVPLLAMFVGSPQLSPTSRLAIATALLAALLGVALIRPSTVLAAKLRRAAEVAEVLLIITTIPLALGALDVYTDLLETFR